MTSYRSKHIISHNGPNDSSGYDSEATRVGIAHDAGKGVKSWRESMASTSRSSTLLSPDLPPDMFSDTESSLQCTESDAFSEEKNMSGPRYGKHNSSMHHNFLTNTFFVVYYRVYTKDGAIPSNAPMNTEDPYLARIAVKSVTPPHTVSSLKRCLSKVENIVNYRNSSLFLSISSHTLMDDGHRLSLLNRSGPGSIPQEPMALVVKLSESERNALAAVRTSADVSTACLKVRYRK